MTAQEEGRVQREGCMFGNCSFEISQTERERVRGWGGDILRGMTAGLCIKRWIYRWVYMLRSDYRQEVGEQRVLGSCNNKDGQS